MSTQHGFISIQVVAPAAKPANSACKDFKNLSPEVNFRRIYEYAGGDWTEQDVMYTQNVLLTTYLFHVNHCDDPGLRKSLSKVAPCTNAKMVLWW